MQIPDQSNLSLKQPRALFLHVLPPCKKQLSIQRTLQSQQRLQMPSALKRGRVVKNKDVTLIPNPILRARDFFLYSLQSVPILQQMHHGFQARVDFRELHLARVLLLFHE